MSPTYERSARFARDMRKLSGEQRRAFLAARDELVAGLRTQPHIVWLRIGTHAILDDPDS